MPEKGFFPGICNSVCTSGAPRQKVAPSLIADKARSRRRSGQACRLAQNSTFYQWNNPPAGRNMKFMYQPRH
jgi:hypothetical protein